MICPHAETRALPDAEHQQFLCHPDPDVPVLRDENLFRQVRIELGAVAWPGNLDLAPDAMHRAVRKHGTWIVE
jgi:hypothetical protein